MRRIILFRRQLHVISRSQISSIKPSSPTPGKLKQYRLPLHDRMMPTMYIPTIFFYQNSAEHKSAISDQLKNSLSETLSKYYPFAGRLRSSGSYVDCNDEGVHFLEAHIGCKLSHMLDKASVKEDEEGLTHLFPPHAMWDSISDYTNSSLMLVQLNHFTCGGLALAVSLTHRIGDGLSLFSFLIYWAGLSRHGGDHQKLLHLRPHFVYELLPQSNDNDSMTYNVLMPQEHGITKEIVFHNSYIAKLKSDVELKDKQQGLRKVNYTRNELVTALLYRCAVAAAALSNSGEYAKSVLCHTVNMRPMIDPPLPQTTLGNLITFNHVPTSTENETDINLLVERMRKGKMLLRGSKGMDGHITAPILQGYIKSNHKFYGITSICNFPLYEVDFGWGRPLKVTLGTPAVNCMALMDTPSGDGIEAVLSLGEKDMENFQDNKELLTYGYF